jgi:hypothetical protein
MALIKQEEVYPAAVTPWASAMEMVATAAIAQYDVVIVDGASGAIPKASPASSAAPETSSTLLYVAAGRASAAGDKFFAVPWQVIQDVDTSSGSVGDPVYLGTGGDWSLSAGAEGRIIGMVIASSATVGKVLLAPGQYMSKAGFSTEVVTHEFFEDFIQDPVDWTKTADSTGTAVAGDALFGVLTITNAATTDDDATQEAFDNETFQLVSGKRLIFEARIRCAAGDATNLDFFLGLAEAEDLTGVADNMPANGIGFHKDDGDALIDASSSDGGTNLQTAGVATLVDNTWTVLKLVFDGGATGAATITPYVDGTAGTAISAVTYATMALLSPVFMVRNGDATTQQTLEVDYVRVIQER